MGLILNRRDCEPSFLEKRALGLRLRATTERKEAWKYKEGDRKHNAQGLRKLWSFIAEAEAIGDICQRGIVALSAATIPAVARVNNSLGEIAYVHLWLDVDRSYAYRSDRHVTVPPRAPVAVTPEAHLQAIQQYCEFALQQRGNEVTVRLHDIRLMRDWHANLNPEGKLNRVRCINVDGWANTFDKERPNYKKLHGTVNWKQLSEQYLQERSGRFLDSARLLGERAVLQADYTRRPVLNTVLCLFTEVSRMISEARGNLHMLSSGIFKEVSRYKGFTYAEATSADTEPRTMQYVPGVIIFSGAAVTACYAINALKYDYVRKMLAAGALSLDTPGLTFGADYTMCPDEDRRYNAFAAWQSGQEFVQRKLEPLVRPVLRKYNSVA